MCNLIMSRKIFVLIICLISYSETNGDFAINLLEKFSEWECTKNASAYPVDYINMSLVLVNNTGTNLRVTLEGVSEDFVLSLFANPYVKNESECPNRISPKDEDLRQSSWAPSPITTQIGNREITYKKIFTGCYYAMMTLTPKGDNFLFGPKFFQTNYRYRDVKLTLVKKDVRPQDTYNSKVFKTWIRARLKCLIILARLYEWKRNITNSTDDSVIKKIIEDQSNEKQSCKIFSNGAFECGEPNLRAKPVLEVKVENVTNDEWIADISWLNLSREDNAYYLKYEPQIIQECDKFAMENNLTDDLRSWMARSVGILDDRVNETPNNEAFPPKDESFHWILIVIGVVVVIAMVVLLYWIRRCRTLPLHRLGNKNTSGEKQQPPSSIDGIESNDILVIYKKEDQGPLMKQINRLKIYLKENLSDFDIHDVYDERNDWSRIHELGALGWVEEMLKRGSKIVWVDTPEFRSCAKNEQKHYQQGDFRDTAIPYAVTMAKDSFQDLATQYRRHFVVRVKGFEVQDGDDDPLQTVTPYVRYYIPDQLPLLYEQLRSRPSECSEISVTEV